MAILALYSHPRTLQVALDGDSRVQTAAFPSGGPEIIEEHLLPWLAQMGISAEGLRFVVTNESSRLSRSLSERFDLPVHLVDPARHRECWLQSYVTGTPALERRCQTDTFIFRYLAGQEAAKRDRDRTAARCIVAHLDQENQFGALIGTRLIDGLSSLDEGPFALRQSGGLPFDAVLDLCQVHQERQRTLRALHEEGGLRGYLGLESLEELWTKQDHKAELIRAALAYQISKEIGALAAALEGRIDAIILGGELVAHQPFCVGLQERIGFLGPVALYPGNQALPALLAGAKTIHI